MAPELPTGRMDELDVLPGECSEKGPLEPEMETVHAVDLDGDGVKEVLHVDADLDLVIVEADGDPEDPCTWKKIRGEIPLITDSVSTLYADAGLADVRGAAVPERVRMTVLGDGRSLRIDIAAVPHELPSTLSTGAYGYVFLSFLLSQDETLALAAAAPVSTDAAEFESVTYWSRRDGSGLLQGVKITWSVHPALDRLVALFVRGDDGVGAATEKTWDGWVSWIEAVNEADPLPGQDLMDLRTRLSAFMPTDRAPDIATALKAMALGTVEMLVEHDDHQQAYEMAMEEGIMGQGFEDPELEKRRMALVAEIPAKLAGGWQASVMEVAHEGAVAQMHWHLDGRLVFRLQGGAWYEWDDGSMRVLSGEELEVTMDEALPRHLQPKFKWLVDFVLQTPDESCDPDSPPLFGTFTICRRKAPTRCNVHTFLDRGNVPFPWDADDAPGGLDALDLVAFGRKHSILVARRDLLLHLVAVPIPEKDPDGELADPCGTEDVDTFAEAETLADLTGYMDYLTSSPYTIDGLSYLYGDDGGIWLGSFQPDHPDLLIVPMEEDIERAIWSPDGDRIAALDAQGHLHVASVERPGLTPVTLDDSEID